MEWVKKIQSDECPLYYDFEKQEVESIDDSSSDSAALVILARDSSSLVESIDSSE